MKNENGEYHVPQFTKVPQTDYQYNVARYQSKH